MRLAEQIAPPTRALTETALSGLSVAGILPAGEAGQYRVVTAQPPSSAYAAQQTLVVARLTRSATTSASFPVARLLRIPASGHSPLPIRFPLVVAASTRSRTGPVALASQNVSGVLPAGEDGRYRQTQFVLDQGTGPSATRALDFSDTTPAAPVGYWNIRWQIEHSAASPRHVSACVPLGSPGNPGLVMLSGDLAGVASGPKVAGLQGVPMASIPPADKQVLTFNAAAGTWQPQAASGGTASGSFAILANGSTIAVSDAGGFTISLDGTFLARYS